MITEYQELIKTLADTSTRSGERLNILSGFVKNFPPEKITKLKTLSVEWEELGGELVPTLDVEFFS